MDAESTTAMPWRKPLVIEISGVTDLLEITWVPNINCSSVGRGEGRWVIDSLRELSGCFPDFRF